MDNDSVRKSLIVNLNMERPVSAVQRVFLDEVQIIHAGDLHAEETKHATFTVTAKSHIFYPPITCARLKCIIYKYFTK